MYYEVNKQTIISAKLQYRYQRFNRTQGLNFMADFYVIYLNYMSDNIMDIYIGNIKKNRALILMNCFVALWKYSVI